MPAERARLRRIGRGLLTALVVAASLGVASAQSYTIEQGGRTLGSFEVALAQGADGSGGTVSDSKLDLTGLATLTDHLVSDAAGHVSSYRLKGTARGAPVTIEVGFSADRAHIAIDQAGHQQALDVALPGPVAVIDNNMLDGWQVLARLLDPTASAPRTFDVLVPQAALTGTVTFTSAGEEGVDVVGRQVRAHRYDAVLAVAGQHVAVTLWLDDAGTIQLFEQPSASLRYVLQTPAAKTAASAAEATAVAALDARLKEQRACVRERDVKVTSTGETLAGTLSVPTGPATQGRTLAPALLLLPGSGAVDRNGDAPPLITNGMYRQLAYALGCRGYAVLRIDKLGIGASSGNGNAVTLETYAQNTADWMALLRAQPDLDPRRVGLMGHSEGGLVALFATARGYVTPAAVVLLESPGRPLGQILLDQLVQQARTGGASDARVATVEAQTRAALAAIEASQGTTLDLTGALADNPIAGMFAHAAGLLRSELTQDPVALAAAVEAPVLVVQGGKDVQVKVPNGEALAAAAPHATYLIFPDLEHDLYTTDGPAMANALPGRGTMVAPSLVDALASYLLGALVAAP